MYLNIMLFLDKARKVSMETTFNYRDASSKIRFYGRFVFSNVYMNLKLHTILRQGTVYLILEHECFYGSIFNIQY